MSSSFPKHFCLHRFVAFFSSLLVAGSFIVLTRKECQTVILAQEDGKWYDPIVAQNESLMQSAKEYFVTHYYDMLQIYHGIIIATGALLFVLAFVNIAPAQEDVRFGFHLLVIIMMGGITVLSIYCSYQAYHRPCHHSAKETTSNSVIGNINSKNKNMNINDDNKYEVQIRLNKDKTPVNSYAENDNYMLAVSGLDGLTSLLLLIATIIFGIDAREEAIQDEYVPRVRGPY